MKLSLARVDDQRQAILSFGEARVMGPRCKNSFLALNALADMFDEWSDFSGITEDQKAYWKRISMLIMAQQPLRAVPSGNHDPSDAA